MIPALLTLAVTSTAPATLERCRQDLVWTAETYEAALDQMTEEHRHASSLCQIRVTELRVILASRTASAAAALLPPREDPPTVADDGPGWGWVLGAGAVGLAVGALGTIIALAAGGTFHGGPG